MQGRHGHGPGSDRGGLPGPVPASKRRAPQRLAGTLNAAQILGLPWGPFLLWTIATGALTSLVPAWALGVARAAASDIAVPRSSHRRCMCLGYRRAALPHDYRSSAIWHWALNGRSWTQRFQVLAVRSGVGAVWGATTAIVVVLMTRRFGSRESAEGPGLRNPSPGGLALVLIAPLLIAVLAPFAGYLAGPRGLVAGAPELRKAVSLAPSQDRSQGETVLAYSHDVAIPVARMPAPVISPDGQSAIVRAVDHTLMQVDLATGRGMRQLAGALAPLDRHAIAWSPDGRYSRASQQWRGGADPEHPLYAASEPHAALRAAGFDIGRRVLKQRGRLLRCFRPRADAVFQRQQEPVAGVRPNQRTEARRSDGHPARRACDAGARCRRYGEGAESGEIRGLERIGDSVWAWQFAPDGMPFRIRDLTHARDIVTVPIPAELIGKLTAQTGQSQVDEQTIRLNFCGVPPGAPAGAGPESWICRMLTFDTRTGALIGSVDRDDHRVPNPPASLPKAMLFGHGLRIESFWRATARPANSSSATAPPAASVNGLSRSRNGRCKCHAMAWLMTLPVNGSGLRLYRIQL